MRVSFCSVKGIKGCMLLAGLLLLILSGGSFAGCSSDRPVESTSFLMDTVVTQKWYGEKAEETCREIEAMLKELEQKVSLFLTDSEVSKINAAAGKEYVPVSEEIYSLIAREKELCEESGGIFDDTIAPLVLLWDVTGEDPHVPEPEEIDEALSKIDYTKVLLDEETRSVMLEKPGMMLDLGGSAKGLAAGMMRGIAEKNGVSGYLSIGGNMLVVGKKPDGADFVIGIRDPLKGANDYFATITLDGETMATSSAVERFFEQDGVVYHHILNPFTGYPGETDLLSVTVVSEDGLLADTLSTTIFLLGSSCLEEYLNRDDCLVLAVTDDNEVLMSDALKTRVTPAEGDTYRFVSA